MKHKSAKIYLTLIFTPLFLVTGFIISFEFLSLVYLNFEGVETSSPGIGTASEWRSQFVFSSAIGILPILMLISDVGVCYDKAWKFLITIITTWSIGLFFLFCHIYYLKSRLESIEQITPNIKDHISSTQIYAEWYLGIGFIVGSLSSILFFMFFFKSKEIK